MYTTRGQQHKWYDNVWMFFLKKEKTDELIMDIMQHVLLLSIGMTQKGN